MSWLNKTFFNDSFFNDSFFNETFFTDTLLQPVLLNSTLLDSTTSATSPSNSTHEISNENGSQDIERVQEISLYIMATHLTLYLSLLLIISFISAFNVRKESKQRKKAKSTSPASIEPKIEKNHAIPKSASMNTDQMCGIVKFEKEWKWYTPFKKWFKSVQQKRKVYISLVPHLFDQAV